MQIQIQLSLLLRCAERARRAQSGWLSWHAPLTANSQMYMHMHMPAGLRVRLPQMSKTRAGILINC